MDNKNFNESMLRKYLRVLFRYKTVVLISFFSVMICVFIGAEFKTPVYEAEVKMLISGQKQIESTYYRDASDRDTQIALTQSVIVKSRPVLERAVISLKLFNRRNHERRFASHLKRFYLDIKSKMDKNQFENLTPERMKELSIENVTNNLGEAIRIEPIRSTSIFKIIVTDFSPEEAKSIANVVSRSYVIFDLQQQLAETTTKYGEKHPAVQQLRDTIWAMNQNLSGDTIPTLEAIGPASVKILEQATVPFQTEGQSKRVTYIIGIFLSLLLGIGLSLLLDYVDQTFRTPSEIVTFLNLPVLGSIPKYKFFENSLVLDASPKNIHYKFYEELADQIIIYLKVNNSKSILVSSFLAHNGNSTIIANLGLFFSKKMGYNVLIIDANIKHPGLNEIFKLNEKTGFANVLKGEHPDKLIKHLDTNLSILPSGDISSTSISLFNTINKHIIPKEIKSKYDVILIDSANLNNFNDANILSRIVDGIILVVNEGKDKREIVKMKIAQLNKENSNLLGIILNNRTFVIPQLLYKVG